MDEQELLARALLLSVQSVEAGGGPFGAVVACDGAILGEGTNRVTLDRDPSLHAEIVAIRNACRKVGAFSLRGAVLFASTEPCPMCFSATHWARIERIVHAATRDDAARAGFDDAVLYAELALPASERRMPSLCLEVPHALRAFELWNQKTDRVPY